MKQWICGIMVVVLLFSFSGCARETSAPETADAESPIPQETEPVSVEETPLPEAVEEEPESMAQPTPPDAVFVRIRDYIPDIIIDLRYAGTNNFTGSTIYDFDEAWLRYGTVRKLMLVQSQLREMGLSLKIWDAYRPVEAQFKLWRVCPDPIYVADPNKGYSKHSYGCTVDVTLCTAEGEELTMPSGFDDFTLYADRDYSDCSEEARDNALLLENLMLKFGFWPYEGEWWHFTDTDKYSVETELTPIRPVEYLTTGSPYIFLRVAPEPAAQPITVLVEDQSVMVHATCGEYLLVEYAGVFGFIPTENGRAS